tara:strand:+ start:485 stop:976 length:492 start_codon:yes stop_codon:yes gene_type:complete
MSKTKEKEIKVLTEKEKNFAELFVENFFSQDTKTNTEIAKLAGYAAESAYQRGYENTTYKIKPHVVNHIEMLKEDFRIRNQITPDKHMARLHHIGRKAEDEKMLGVAMNAEVYRGKMAGYYVEKKLIANQTIEDLSEEQLEDKMKKLAEQFELIEGKPNDKRK